MEAGFFKGHPADMTGLAAEPAVLREARAIGYSAGNFGKNLMWSSADLVLMFLLTGIIGLPPGWAGTAMLVAICCDVCVDLLAGRFNAGLVARGFAYRHLLYVLAPPCALAFAALFWLPHLAPHSGAWIFVALCLFRVLYGLVDVPHNAMMPLMADGAAMRGRIAGYRFFFSSMATLFVAIYFAPAVATATGADRTSDITDFATVFAGFAMAALLLAGISDHRRAEPVVSGAASRRILPHIAPDLICLLAIGFLAGFALAMFSRSMLYYGQHYLHAPMLVSSILASVVLGQFAGVALWSVLSQRLPVGVLMAAANALAALLVLVFALSPSEWLTSVAVLVGIALAGVFQLPWAALSEIIEANGHLPGERFEPQTVSIFLVALKLGAALSMVVTGWVLSLADYSGAASGSADVAWAVQVLTIVPPVLGGLTAAWLCLRLGKPARFYRVSSSAGAEPVSGL